MNHLQLCELESEIDPCNAQGSVKVMTAALVIIVFVL